MTVADEPPAGSAQDQIVAGLEEGTWHVARTCAGFDEDLQRQYAKLSDGWSRRIDSGHPIAQLMAGITRSLVEAGFDIHDCTAKARTGGVCLTPASTHDGVIVTWTTHDALSLDPQRYSDNTAAHEVMNFALYDTLLALGWEVREHGQAGANLVIGRRRADCQEDSMSEHPLSTQDVR